MLFLAAVFFIPEKVIQSLDKFTASGKLAPTLGKAQIAVSGDSETRSPQYGWPPSQGLPVYVELPNREQQKERRRLSGDWMNSEGIIVPHRVPPHPHRGCAGVFAFQVGFFCPSEGPSSRCSCATSATSSQTLAMRRRTWVSRARACFLARPGAGYLQTTTIDWTTEEQPARHIRNTMGGQCGEGQHGSSVMRPQAGHIALRWE